TRIARRREGTVILTAYSKGVPYEEPRINTHCVDYRRERACSSSGPAARDQRSDASHEQRRFAACCGQSRRVGLDRCRERRSLLWSRVNHSRKLAARNAEQASPPRARTLYQGGWPGSVFQREAS